MLRDTPHVSISMRTKVEHSATAVKRGGVKRRVVHNSQSWSFCREREVNEAGSRRAATDDVDRPRLRVKLNRRARGDDSFGAASGPLAIAMNGKFAQIADVARSRAERRYKSGPAIGIVQKTAWRAFGWRVAVSAAACRSDCANSRKPAGSKGSSPRFYPRTRRCSGRPCRGRSDRTGGRRGRVQDQNNVLAARPLDELRQSSVNDRPELSRQRADDVRSSRRHASGCCEQ
jgi:hypothetical protein